ncbi:MAG: GTPase domain-containing protein [Cardiobacteriaceae bacterium]|nr:GTPase domain-containing protein [Cardiobacteriaceae bacterium]
MKPIHQLPHLVRKALILLIALLLFALLFLMFQFTEVVFSVWGKLREVSWWFVLVYLGLVAGVSYMGIRLMLRTWRSGKMPKAVPRLASLQEIQQQMQSAKEQGLDTLAVEQELAHYQSTPPKQLTIAFFGKISTGKSALIQTLVPEAEVDISIIGGSTSSISQYQYQLGNLDLILLDMPGTQQVHADTDQNSDTLKAARRAHIIIYVCDQDLTQSDMDSIGHLNQLNKPMMVVLNKISRYNAHELQLLKTRIRDRLPASIPFATSDSLYERSVKVIDQHGQEQSALRVAGGDVREMLQVLSKQLQHHEHLAEQQRQAILELASETLNLELRGQRYKKGQALVKAYTQKAIISGVATPAPGMDLIIQGYLGLTLLKELCKLYHTPSRDIDLQQLIDQANHKLKKHFTLILALAGNVCKAFPGVGTLLGGASHAVAYGLIFESLGNALLKTLDQQQPLHSTLNHFESELNHDLEKRAKHILKYLLSSGKQS